MHGQKRVELLACDTLSPELRHTKSKEISDTSSGTGRTLKYNLKLTPPTLEELNSEQLHNTGSLALKPSFLFDL